MIDTLINADCLVAMKNIPDKSVDMVLCDLPYGVLNKSNNAAKWDCVIPMEPLWEQWLRITKDNAAIVLFGQGMFTAKLMMSQPKLWKYNLIWDKMRTTSFLNANRMPLRCHEDIIVFYDKMPVYHPQMWKCLPHERNHRRGTSHDETNNCYGEFKQPKQLITDEKYPRSIISVSQGHSVGNFFHPTQKPVDLLRYLIRTYTDVGGVVLDNTMGSGSTCVAAVMEHRHYIGIEKEKKFFDIALKRVRQVEMSPTFLLE